MPIQYQNRSRPTDQYAESKDASNTLVVENIPEQHLDIASVTAYFSRFGRCINISIFSDKKRAIVQFASNTEAKEAHSCPDPIFGNRFVKVYFQRNRSDSIHPSSRPRARSAVVDPATLAMQERLKRHMAQVAINTEREKVYQKQVEQEKDLVEKLASAEGGSAALITRMLTLLRQQMENTKPHTLENQPSTPFGTLDPDAKPNTSEKDRLDQELDSLYSQRRPSDPTHDQATDMQKGANADSSNIQVTYIYINRKDMACL